MTSFGRCAIKLSFSSNLRSDRVSVSIVGWSFCAADIHELFYTQETFLVIGSSQMHEEILCADC